MLEDAWSTFRSGLYEIRTLLEAAAKAEVFPTHGRLVTEQQVYIRAAIIILASHLEGFFRTLPDEYVEQINDMSWNGQSPGVRRFVALQAMNRLKEEFDKVGQCEDENKREILRRSVVSTARWFNKPGRVQELKAKPKLTGFYRQSGSQPLESFLLEFHPNRTPFFRWLTEKEFDRGRFWTVVEGLINARNEIAHGDASFSLTLAEVRSYVAICTVLVRQVRIYVE